MKTKLEQKELWFDKYPNSFTNRVKETIKFINPTGAVADCGENNPMKESIEKYFNIKITSLDWNFNEKHSITEKYDTILCFEVLEHVFNPLLFLEELKRILNPGGKIYISTPYQYPQFLKAIHHYHEIPKDRLMWLFTEANLHVVTAGKVTIAGNWYNHILGFRPILRYFQKSRIFLLKVE